MSFQTWPVHLYLSGSLGTLVLPMRVWQADSMARGNSATDPREPVSAQSGGVESAGGRAASPRWGPSEPPQPVHLEIKVLGKEDSSDRPSASRAGPRADSAPDSPPQPTIAEEQYAGASSFGIEAGYGSHSGVSCQSESTAAGMASKSSQSEAGGVPAAGSGKPQNAGTVATASAKADTSSASLPAQARAVESASAAGSAAAVSHQGLHPGVHVGQSAHPVGSAGQAELAEAAAQLQGSPWDPRQGPKLLESLSDFSSFNSSLSMLQQLAGNVSCWPCHIGDWVLFLLLFFPARSGEEEE